MLILFLTARSFTFTTRSRVLCIRNLKNEVCRFSNNCQREMAANFFSFFPPCGLLYVCRKSSEQPYIYFFSFVFFLISRHEKAMCIFFQKRPFSLACFSMKLLDLSIYRFSTRADNILARAYSEIPAYV